MSDTSEGQASDTIISIRLPRFIHLRIQRCFDMLDYPTGLSYMDVVTDALEFQGCVVSKPSFGVVVLDSDNTFQGCVFERYQSARVNVPANNGYEKAAIVMHAPSAVMDVMLPLEDEVLPFVQELVMGAINLFWTCTQHYSEGRLPVIMDTDTGVAVMCFERWLDERYAE